jgi:hypothetical protein
VLCRDEALKNALNKIDTLTPWDKGHFLQAGLASTEKEVLR